MHPNKRISFFICFVILYAMLASGRSSLTPISGPWLTFGAAVVCYFYFAGRSAFKITSGTLLASSLLIISSMYTMHGGSIPGYMSQVMVVSLAVILLNLKNNFKIELLYTVSKWFAILLVVSVVAWVIHFVLPLPHISEIREVAFSRNGLQVNNYFFFQEALLNEVFYDYKLRFQGMFLEPGHLGTIVAFFLIATQYDFSKRETWVFLVVVLISLSAAAYVLAGLGYLFYRISYNKATALLRVLTVVSILGVFFLFYNGGDNIINEMIFGKLTRETGVVEGRVNEDAWLLYQSMLMRGSDILFGKGTFNVEIVDSAGIIVYFIMNGVFGIILLVLAYYSIFRTCPSKYGKWMLVIYLVSFLQRTYPYWDAFLDPFILGLPFFLQVQREIESKKLNCKIQII